MYIVVELGTSYRNRMEIPVAKLILFVLLFGSCAHCDEWTFFHPESVKSFGCRVLPIDLAVNGSNQRVMIWEAEARAERNDGTAWLYDVARFPLDLKGRHKAEKACSKWMDVAEKLVKASR